MTTPNTEPGPNTISAPVSSRLVDEQLENCKTIVGERLKSVLAVEAWIRTCEHMDQQQLIIERLEQENQRMKEALEDITVEAKWCRAKNSDIMSAEVVIERCTEALNAKEQRHE